MKVYELAKKLEVTSVFLMNKIKKEWKLPVKNHMEALSPELLQTIEKNFRKSQQTLDKKAVSKSKKTKTVSVKKAGAKKTVIKKTELKKEKTSKSSKKESDKKATAELKSADSQAPKKTIIIRRQSEEKAPDTAPSDSSTLPTEKKAETKSISPHSSSSKSIRLDLVSVKSADPLDESFWNKEEEPVPVKKQPKKPITEKDVSSKFNPTDFRKREMIFQPRKKRTAQAGEFKNTQITTPKSHKRILKIHGEMSIEKLCKKMGLKKQALIKTLKKEGVDTKNLQVLDFETIALIIPAFGWTAKNTKQTESEMLQKLDKKTEPAKDQSLKAPVVTIMGHVDHGKTTLLDCIRKAKVAQGEAGGITQHIGAYSVFLEGKPITFIDTPGHSAFTAMRSRGAKATDIVVILVSADDGAQPQTLEALSHARAAKTPIIIAISKMDAPGANPDKIKKQMSEHNVIPEDWGGDTSFIPISALKGEGIKELLEQIQLLAEMQELKYQEKAPAKGVVLEARKEKGVGCIVSLLIQDGTLHTGETIVAGEHIGRARQMKNDKAQIVQKVSAGFPIEIMGFNELPQAGDSFFAFAKEKQAKELLTLRKSDKSDSGAQKATSLDLEELLAQMKEESSNQKRELNIILKADVGGSLEALKNSLEDIKSDEAVLKIIHSGAGAITESDVLLASTVSGVIFGFNVRPDNKAVRISKEKSVEIYSYSVIYELLDQAKKLMLGLLKADTIEEELGQAEVRDIFHISKVGTVAGCYVTKGKITRSSFIRLVRDGRLIHNGPLSGLRRFKEDVKQVGEGFECGISLEKFNDIKPKDILECYTKKEQARTEL